MDEADHQVPVVNVQAHDPHHPKQVNQIKLYYTNLRKLTKPTYAQWQEDLDQHPCDLKIFQFIHLVISFMYKKE